MLFKNWEYKTCQIGYLKLERNPLYSSKTEAIQRVLSKIYLKLLAGGKLHCMSYI